MANANDFVRAIKKASVDANEAGDPVNVMSGTVTSTRPITVKVEQRFEIGREQLIIPEYLTDHKIGVTLDGETEKAGTPEHRHKYGEKQIMTAYNGLKIGDRVILIRQQGGQKFLIIDRAV